MTFQKRVYMSRMYEYVRCIMPLEPIHTKREPPNSLLLITMNEYSVIQHLKKSAF